MSFFTPARSAPGRAHRAWAAPLRARAMVWGAVAACALVGTLRPAASQPIDLPDERPPIVVPRPVDPERPAKRPEAPGPIGPAPATAPSPGPPADALPAAAEVPEFAVSRFVLSYVDQNPGLPRLADLEGETTVALAQVPGGFVSSAPAAQARAYTLAELNELLSVGRAPRFSRQALRAVTAGVFEAMRARGYIGLLIVADPEDIFVDVRDPSADLASEQNLWSDLRPPGRTTLGLRLYTARVVRLRTVAQGDRVPEAQRVDNPVHARIVAHSPVKPGEPGAPSGRELLRRDLLDDYTLFLNRHPGRRVDAAVSLAEQPQEVVLDYLVRENKPWLLYYQLANNGTEQTDRLRHRFGFIHNQLTNNDDILSIDYVTAGFKDTYALLGSYDFPLVGERLRLRAFGAYSEFDASEVGRADERFTGTSWSGGVDLAWNLFQRRELFVDVVGGARWEKVEVDNQTVDLTGQEDFFIVGGGLRAERLTDLESTTVNVRAEGNVSSVAGTDDLAIDDLGRLDADADWVTVQFSAEHSLYLEPLLDARRFREGRSTLAHEVALRVRGQYTPEARLAPSFQGIAGGSDSVRGYPESVAAGDTSVIGTVEYRVHLPRLLTPSDELGTAPGMILGQTFRARPQTRYARPDWDLVLKAFFDGGRTINNDALSFEEDQTLLSAGVGVELVIGRYVNVRVDWGVALEEIEAPTPVSAGDSELHLVATLIF